MPYAHFFHHHQGFTVPDSTTEPNSIASDVPDSASAPAPSTARPLTTGSLAHQPHAVSSAGANHLTNGHHHNGHTPAGAAPGSLAHSSHISSRYVSAASAAANGPELRHSVSSTSSTGAGGSAHNPAIAYAPQLFDAALSRRSPDGTDNDAYLLAEEQLKPANHHHNGGGGGSGGAGGNHNNNNNNSTSATAAIGKMGNDNISAEIFSTSNDNGKINVQVTVLVGESVFCSVRFCCCWLWCAWVRPFGWFRFVAGCG